MHCFCMCALYFNQTLVSSASSQKFRDKTFFSLFFFIYLRVLMSYLDSHASTCIDCEARNKFFALLAFLNLKVHNQ